MQENRVKAMVHSQKENGVQDVTIISKIGDNNFVVITPDGVKCNAIYNFFSNLYYADDIYGVIEEGKENTNY